MSPDPENEEVFALQIQSGLGAKFLTFSKA